MKKFLFVLLLLALISCKQSPDHVRVHHSGALRNIMSGNLQETVSLDSLSLRQAQGGARKSNLYALGAVKNLKGEIQIFNGNAFNSSVRDDQIILSQTYDLKAALLVWTHVENWETIDIPNDLKSKNDLEKFIKNEAKRSGVDADKPFPFLLEGRVDQLDWHVIDWKDGDTVHTHQKHKDAGLNGSLQDENVQILGFYSQKHKAVFTHHTTFMHMHFKNESESLAGHVDNLKLDGNMILKLPKS